LYILKKTTAILKSEETLLELESPLTGKIKVYLYKIK
jgi:hypothetical protein